MGLVKDDGALVEKLYYNSTGLCKSWDPSGGGNWNTHPDNAAYNLGRSEYIPFGYLGMYRDRFTGKYHTHFREYDPLHARWLSEDPAGYADGLNLYNAYMGVNGIDPLGLGLFGQLLTWVGTGGQCWPESEMAGDMMYLKEAGQGLHNLKEDAITGVVDAGATAYDTYNATRTVITGENHYTETSSMFSSGGTLDKLDAVQKAAKENGLSPTFHSQAWAYGDLFGITNYCNAYSGHSVAFNGSNLAGMNELTKMQRAREAAIGTAKAASAAATVAKGVALTKSALTRKPGEILIPKTKTGGVKPVNIGKAGERAVGIHGPKTPIKINGRKRIPDQLTNKILTEVKNVKKLSYTKQLRDFNDFAVQNGLRFELYTRPDTIVSGPLAEQIINKKIIHKVIPGIE